MMQKKKIAIALGSNMGNRSSNIQRAADALKEEFLENAVLSQVYETKPWGIEDQPMFFNAVVVGYSEWKPPAILNYLKELETKLGRTKREQNGPREIDLDLIAYAEETFEAPGLRVPHPAMAERDFVLLPFCDVWPEWRHPILGKSAQELKKQ